MRSQMKQLMSNKDQRYTLYVYNSSRSPRTRKESVEKNERSNRFIPCHVRFSFIPLSLLIINLFPVSDADTSYDLVWFIKKCVKQ